jgi:hypothetical protein
MYAKLCADLGVAKCADHSSRASPKDVASQSSSIAAGEFVDSGSDDVGRLERRAFNQHRYALQWQDTPTWLCAQMATKVLSRP